MGVDRMIVERTLNTGLCMNIIHDFEVFEAISEDNAPPVRVDVLGDIWLQIVSDEQPIGCVQLIQKTSCSYDSHIHILPKYREQSVEAGLEIWKWIEKNLSGTIYATVPEFCKNVIKFLTKFDFKITGKIKKAWLKNNERHDLIILSREV